MAKIPTGNFGFRVPQGQDTTPMPQVDQQVGDAQTRLGMTAVSLADQEIRRQEAENKVAAERAAQAQALSAHADIQNGLADAFDALNQDVLQGKTDKDAATTAWKETSERIVADGLKGAPADRQQLVAAQVKGLQGQLQNRLFDTFRKRDQQDVAAGLVTYRESMERFAGTDPAAAVKQWNTYVDQQGPAGGWNAEQQAKAKQTFAETVAFNQFRRAGQDAFQSGSVAALDEVQKRMAGPAGEAMDPAKRNVLDQTIFGWRANLEAKAARAEDRAERESTKRFNTATDTLNKGRDLVLSGAALAPEFIATLSEQAQGTGLESQVKDLLAVQGTVSGFANLPAPQRAAVLESARGERADPARGFTPEQERQLKAAEQINDNLQRKIDTGDAWAAAQSVGVVASAPLMNITNPQEAISVFQQRARNIADVETWAGKKVSPLQPQEAEQLQKIMRALKPDQAASLLGQVGAIVDDPERIAAVAKQIGDKDGTMGMAMLYANSKTTLGRYTAEAMLLGDQAIRDKTVKVDGIAETGWRSTIASKVRGAYSNQQVESSAIDAAFLIMAGRANDSSLADRSIDKAIELATGGIIDRNGGKIPLPYGMKEPEFEKRLGAIAPADLAAQAPGGFVQAGPSRVPLADFVKSLPDARLVHAGQGLYNVRAGNTLVTNERGQRITLKVGP